MDVLPASDPDQVLPAVRDVLNRALSDEDHVLEEMGLSNQTDLETVLRQIFEHLQTLRRSNQSYHRLHTLLSTERPGDGDPLAKTGFGDPQRALPGVGEDEKQIENRLNTFQEEIYLTS